MGSKKHHRRETSSSSSEDSDSSGNSRKKPSRKQYSDESGEDRSKSSKTKHREPARTSRDAKQERKDSKYKRSRSRSGDRKVRHRDKSRSRSREPRDRAREHRRDIDKESHSGTSRSADRKDFKDRSYDYNNSRHYNNDRRKDFRRNNNLNRRNRSRSKSFDHANAKWGKSDDQSKDKKKDAENKAKPDFALSGKLAEQTNTYKGVVIKYSEPPEARKPRRRWRLYPFKGDKALQTLYIHRESAYLIGRDRKVVDLAVDHPSCSKQHAALQYRLVPFTRENGSVGKRVRPYLIDLESANGTFINNKKIEPKKYVELLERDVIKFGFSSREYVLLHENSKDETLDDDVKVEDEEIKEEVDIKEEQV